MNRITLLLLILLKSVLIIAENEFYIKEEPQWKENVSFDQNYHLYNNKEDGGTYLLIDFQDHVALKESYRHYAVKIEEENGVQNYSDIWVDYEPAYEKLIFHKMLIHRDGKILQRLKKEDFKIVQNENDLARKIYNGNYSAGINIEDVQVGDIIEYAYTIKGENPVFSNYYFNVFTLEYSIPINKLFIQVLYPKNRDISYKLIKSDAKPVQTNLGDQISLKWELKDVSEVVTNSNLPNWYISFGMVQFSEFNTWSQVIEWSKPLYKQVKIAGSDLGQKFNQLTQNLSSKKDKINKLIRFVQDEVRYVGIEVDEHSHKPHDPFYVYKKRFGDCKDKTYLLVTLLNHLGVDAWPALVNSNLKHNVNLLLPSPNNFNHVIVFFIYNGENYFIDPTISNQRGSFEKAYSGDYRSALVLSDKFEKPIAITLNSIEKIVIHEYIEALDTISPAKYSVISSYYGNEADRTRSNNQNQTQKEMESSYLNFYDFMYPNMRLDTAFKIQDFKDENRILIEEKYRIDKFWKYDDDSDVNDYVACVNASNIETYITNPSQRNRTMPFALYFPIEVENRIVFDMGKDVTIEKVKGEINNSCFNFSYQVKKDGEKVLFSYKYKSLKDFVSVNELDQYYKDIDEISDLIWYDFTYGKANVPTSTSEDDLNWLMIVLTIFFVTILVFFASKLYHREKNTPSSAKEPLPIGGWLIVVSIGIIITPIILAYNIYSGDYFNLTSWVFISSKGSEGYNVFWSLTIIYELFINCILFVYSILLGILFVKRRTIFPLHYIWFRIINLVFLVIAAVLVTQINSPYLNDVSYVKELSRAFFSSLIWIPYMIYSQRVKDTFVN